MECRSSIPHRNALPAMEGSGRFIINGTSLAFGPGRGEWTVPADRILCVGEATIEYGQHGEDWRLCVIIDMHGTWAEASLYSAGRNDALQWLCASVGSSLEVKLAHAPAFRSRVMWPDALRERPLFAYQVSLLRRTFSRSARRLGCAPGVGVQTVHPGVLDYLWRSKRLPDSRSA